MNRNISIIKKSILYLIFLPLAISACTEEPVGQQPADGVAPAAVRNVQVANTAGGAVITYTLPDDDDLLYVKAVYSRKAGEVSESRSSMYRNEVKVEGFGDVEPHEVKIIAVDRSRNESAPVTVTVTPLEPEVLSIARSLNLIADFGGVTASWHNPDRAEISVSVMLKSDSLMEYIPLETFYSSMINGVGGVRGMDTVTGNFAVYVQDHWGNRSEAKYYDLTPVYETLFDRLRFSDASVPGDGPHYTGGGWGLSNLWDGNWGNDAGYSSAGGTGVWPQSITIDIGVLGQISRIRIHQRMGPYTFSEGNPRLFEVWGCQNLDVSGSWDSWTKLMDCESIKPSDQPVGQNSNEDIALALDGEDFINSPVNPKVRYLRFKILRTWAGGDNFQIAEIEVFGDNR
ncbi:MAG: DUF4959 domain-containing protein [Prevotellaceae bacterium]|jgi:hypothetical protein|nr:DUF4959 domain-containing protein [Prevotellaceae bacterium]